MKSKTEKQLDFVIDAVKTAPKKGLKRKQIEEMLVDACVRNGINKITKERFAGVTAALFGVLGYDAKRAHKLAETIVKNHPHWPKSGRLKEITDL
jgi:hypothetical protein